MDFVTVFQQRVYLGNIIGYRILSNYNKIAVSFEDNIPNNILAASIESAYLVSANGRFTNIPLNLSEIPSATIKIHEFSPQSLIVIIGGEDKSYTKSLFKKFASELYNSGFHADILIDGVETDIKTLGEMIVDKEIRTLFEENDTYVFTIDAREGVVTLNSLVSTPDSRIELYVINEFPITFDHGKLLKA